jgi:hypothetical protein
MNPNFTDDEIKAWFENPLMNPRTGRTLDPSAKKGKFKLFCSIYATLTKEECLAWQHNPQHPPKVDIPSHVFNETYPLMPWFTKQCTHYSTQEQKPMSHPIDITDTDDDI